MVFVGRDFEYVCENTCASWNEKQPDEEDVYVDLHNALSKGTEDK